MVITTSCFGDMYDHTLIEYQMIQQEQKVSKQEQKVSISLVLPVSCVVWMDLHIFFATLHASWDKFVFSDNIYLILLRFEFLMLAVVFLFHWIYQNLLVQFLGCK